MSAGFETKSSDSNKRNRHQVKPRQVASIEAIQQSLVENFGDIKDPRVERTKKHHRTEIRQVWSVPISALGELYQPKIWTGLQSVVMVVRERRLWNQTTREIQFYLSSLPSDVQLLGRAIRKHWGIENQAHWILDCTFAEDYCRIRSFHSPRNFALLRRIALNNI